MTPTKIDLCIMVTKEHIAVGSLRHPCLCPVARAAQEAMGLPRESSALMVSPTQITLFGDDNERAVFSFPVPPEVTARIRDFDALRGMTPFAFNISLPEDAVSWLRDKRTNAAKS